MEEYWQAAKLLANIIVMGSGILARAVFRAYREALANASRNGVAQEAVTNTIRRAGTMTELEARQILGVTENTSWEEVLKELIFGWHEKDYFVLVKEDLRSVDYQKDMV
ncbi:hypothetical protein AMTR_s00148p00078250 [Amborella trichopoda]|uniref:Uncharacterized protein n=1 Tax=Amborella trichopoda TaxID=13333 RepID=W1PKW1_AMBTC|nr:hypothetical protein AMTR_s00148p00078250 [Amborella trichopoda]